MTAVPFQVLEAALPWVAQNSEKLGERQIGFIQGQSSHAGLSSRISMLLDRPLASVLAVHVVRDPRDLLVSGYFSHKFSHPPRFFKLWPTHDEAIDISAHRDRLLEFDLEQGLLAKLEVLDWTFRQMDEWDYHDPRILNLKLEDFMRDGVASLSKSLEFMGIADQMPTGAIANIIASNSFGKLTGGRAVGEEDTKSHSRKGTPGDWKNHFSEPVLQAFNDRWAGLLAKLDYPIMQTIR